MHYYDVLIIGSGAAGLGVALSLSDHASVAVVTKDALATGASLRAQGGIAAVIDQQHDLESHVQDTLIAGAGLCDETVVRFTVYQAKEAIHWLIAQGVQFNKNHDSEFHLTQEGGHRHRRILHVADKTGDAVITSLSSQITKRKNIVTWIEHTAINLLLEDDCCIGVTLFDNDTSEIKSVFSKIIVLATGGASSVYLHASNPDVNSGDGIAMAHRIGADIAQLEFHQFHPTCLFHPKANSFLISEALRGEGAILKLKNGDAFMHRYDARKELASRDIVARAIHTEMKKNSMECVYLDITHLPAEKITSHFPTIFEKCYSLGIDMTKDWIPVVPAAHYTCGGVKTNLQGETNIKNLFAVGEVACTGLHGANRMASNSLLECIVFAASAAQKIQLMLPTISKIGKTRREKSIQHAKLSSEIDNTLQYHTAKLKQCMWEKAGIIKNDRDLQLAKIEIQKIQQIVESLYNQSHVSKALIELRNLACVSRLMVQAAIDRKENIGLYFNTDRIVIIQSIPRPRRF